jgi:hypothetical protein
MRLIVAAFAMVLALGSTALAQTVDQRAPDQVAPAQEPVVPADLRAPDQVAPAHEPVVPADLRAPDQIAPAQGPVVPVDLRAPDQIAPAQQSVDPTDLRAPDQQSPAAAPTLPVVPDGGPATLVFVLIALGASLVLVAGGYGVVRHRRRPAIADDLVTG